MQEEHFLKAVRLARIGAKQEAIELFQLVLEEDPTDERAWLWLVDCLETPELRRQALETCLKINPQAERARTALDRLYITPSPVAGHPIAVTGAALAGAVAARPVQDEKARRAEASVFTASPDAVSPEEVAEREARVFDLLAYRPDAVPGESPWDELEQAGEALTRSAQEQAGRSTEPSPAGRRRYFPSREERRLSGIYAALAVLVVLLLLAALLISGGGIR